MAHPDHPFDVHQGPNGRLMLRPARGHFKHTKWVMLCIAISLPFFCLLIFLTAYSILA